MLGKLQKYAQKHGGFFSDRTVAVGMDFSKKALGHAFRNVFGDRIREMEFHKCNFSGADMSGLFLYHVSFKNCNLKETRFDHCKANNVVFQDCFMREAQFVHSTFADTRYVDSVMPQSYWRDIQFRDLFMVSKTNMSESWWTNVTLDGCDINKSDLSRMTCKEITLRNSKIHDCVLRDTSFHRFSWDNSVFAKCSGPFQMFDGYMQGQWKNCFFPAMRMENVKIQYSNILDTSLDASRLTSVLFDQCELINVSIGDYNPRGLVHHAVWEDVRGENCLFHKTDLTRATYTNCHLNTANQPLRAE